MEKNLKFVHKLSEKEIVEVKQLEKINKDDRNVYYKLCPQSLDGTDESVFISYLKNREDSPHICH